MKTKIWKRVRRLEIGTTLYPNTRTESFIDDRMLRPQFKFPITWNGKPATLYFNKRRSEAWQLNSIATELLAHPNVSVYGTVCILEKIEKRFKMVAYANLNTVHTAIAHFGLSAEPILQQIGCYRPATNIYAATENDLFGIKMCL